MSQFRGMETSKTIKYFPGLNALRFIAATLVIFHHTEQYKHWAGMGSMWGHTAIDSLGHKSVSFFFVLSGFLITYLLLSEHNRTGRIHVAKFYMRRILRIWPLYFLIVALALLVMPLLVGKTFEQAPFGLPVILSLLLFFPNLLRIFRPTIVGANQLWSVGIEEQFYLIWPLLVRAFVHRIIPFLISFLALKLFVHAILIFSVDQMIGSSWQLRLMQIERLYALFPVEQMAVGGLGASLIFNNKQSILKFIYSPILILFSTAGIVILALYGIHAFFLTYIEAVFFTVIIMGICKYPLLHNPLEWKPFKHLGNISYGIYMWHTIAIALVLTALKSLGWSDHIYFGLILNASSVILTLIISHFSYTYFEKPFLKLKSQFEFKNVKAG